MSLLDKQILGDLGIVLADQDYELLSEHFDTTLQQRVIEEIVAELAPDQAYELAALQNASDAELAEWLRANVAAFAQIVSDEIDILLGELAENSAAFSRHPDKQL